MKSPCFPHVSSLSSMLPFSIVQKIPHVSPCVRHDFSLKPIGPRWISCSIHSFPHEIHHGFSKHQMNSTRRSRKFFGFSKPPRIQSLWWESFLAFLNLPESKVYGGWSSFSPWLQWLFYGSWLFTAKSLVNRDPSDAKPTALPPRSGRPQPPRIFGQRRNLAKKNLRKSGENSPCHGDVIRFNGDFAWFHRDSYAHVGENWYFDYPKLGWCLKKLGNM